MKVITDEVFSRMISLANSEVFDLLMYETKHIDIKDFDELGDMQRVYAHYQRIGRILVEKENMGL